MRLVDVHKYFSRSPPPLAVIIFVKSDVREADGLDGGAQGHPSLGLEGPRIQGRSKRYRASKTAWRKLWIARHLISSSFHEHPGGGGGGGGNFTVLAWLEQVLLRRQRKALLHF